MHRTGSDLLAPIALARCVRQLPKYATTTTTTTATTATATSVLGRIVPFRDSTSYGGHILQHCACVCVCAFVRATSKCLAARYCTHTHTNVVRNPDHLCDVCCRVQTRAESRSGLLRQRNPSRTTPFCSISGPSTLAGTNGRTLGACSVTPVIEIVGHCCTAEEPHPGVVGYSVERAKATTKHTHIELPTVRPNYS